MLGKLIKHEFIADCQLFVPTYSVVLVLAVLGRFLTWLTTRQAIADAVSSSFATVLQGLSSVISILFVIAFLAAMVLTLVYLIYRFYKNFFTDEGYLMMTLPTRSGNLVLSKFVNGIIWVAIGILVIFASLYITFSQSTELMDSFSKLWTMITHSGDTAYIEKALGTKPAVFIGECVFYILVWLCRFIISWYFAIAFGQLLYKKHKIVGAVLAYLILLFAESILKTIYMWFQNAVLSDVITNYSTNTGVALQSTMIGTSVVSVLLCVALFFATSLIMERKLNLD